MERLKPLWPCGGSLLSEGLAVLSFSGVLKEQWVIVPKRTNWCVSTFGGFDVYTVLFLWAQPLPGLTSLAETIVHTSRLSGWQRAGLPHSSRAVSWGLTLGFCPAEVALDTAPWSVTGNLHKAKQRTEEGMKRDRALRGPPTSLVFLNNPDYLFFCGLSFCPFLFSQTTQWHNLTYQNKERKQKRV